MKSSEDLVFLAILLKESFQAQTHPQDDSICAKLIFGTNSIFWLDITLVECRNVVF